MIKVLVCGGRDFDNEDLLFRVLNAQMRRNPFILLIHGDARGADTLAGKWARVHGVQEVSCPANWDMHGKAAGARRNAMMLSLEPDLVIAFPGGRGTAHMVEIARVAKVRYQLIDPQGNVHES